jgi:hypothetical protein
MKTEFDLIKFISLAGIEDAIMHIFFDKAEAAGLSPTFDIYHVRAGDERPTQQEIEIMKEVFEKYVLNSKYEPLYKNADQEFEVRLSEKNKRRFNDKIK